MALRSRAVPLLLLAVVATAGGAFVAQGCSAAVEELGVAGDRLVTPLQRTQVAVRVRTDGSSSIALRLRSRNGYALSERVRLRTRGRKLSRLQLPLTGAGRRMLGPCARSEGVTLEVRSAANGRLLEQASVPLTRDRLRCAPLRWAPPAVAGAEVLRPGQGLTRFDLDPARDYVVELPREQKVGGLALRGGRNVTVIGGSITLPADAASGDERRAIAISGATGTVHIEGVSLDLSAGGGEGDAISIDAPQAVVQVQNVRAVGVRGRQRGVHGDVIQAWGGVRELRVDRLTASSHYQGLFLGVDFGPIGAVVLQSADLTALPGLEPGGGHMLWIEQGCQAFELRMHNVFIRPRRERTLATTVWPQPGGGDGGCAARVRERTAAWPGTRVAGGVVQGLPRGGHFVPWGVPGVAYRSPGYRSAS